jgi:hypothetical protein
MALTVLRGRGGPVKHPLPVKARNALAAPEGALYSKHRRFSKGLLGVPVHCPESQHVKLERPQVL